MPQTNDSNKGALIFGLIGGIAFVVFMLWPSNTPSNGTSTYSGYFGSEWAVSASQVQFEAGVTNTGSQAASPTCSVSLTDPITGNQAYDSFDVPTVAPGKSKVFSGYLTVPNNAARSASSWTPKVKCTNR
jgi:hypothetical protein